MDGLLEVGTKENSVLPAEMGNGGPAIATNSILFYTQLVGKSLVAVRSHLSRSPTPSKYPQCGCGVRIAGAMVRGIFAETVKIVVAIQHMDQRVNGEVSFHESEAASAFPMKRTAQIRNRRAFNLVWRIPLPNRRLSLRLSTQQRTKD
jgi:hypothetical protein